MQTVGSWWMWASFFLFVFLMIMADLWLFGGDKKHKVSFREASAWVSIWCVCAMAFYGLLWWYLQSLYGLDYAKQKSLEFLTGYVIEQSLSVDNMFAFIIIFNYFSVPVELQRRVLLYGVLSAIVMRLIMILAGTWMVAKIHWALYLFGFFLLVTGVRILFSSQGPVDLMKNPIVQMIRRHIRLTEQLEGENFFIKKDKFWYATPLFLTLILIEMSDLVFALDSIPAIFAITQDPFIIFTSNCFAILGLRALYFLLVNMAERFHLLRYGIALILILIGAKMLLAAWMTVPIFLSLTMIVVILVTTVILSLFSKRFAKKRKYG